jgi:hypothetical protein
VSLLLATWSRRNTPPAHGYAHRQTASCTLSTLMPRRQTQSPQRVQGAAAAQRLREQEEAAAASAAERESRDAAIVEHLDAVSRQAQLDVCDLDQDAVRRFRDCDEFECPILCCDVPKVRHACAARLR